MPGHSDAPYCRSVTTARARLRSLFTTTISRSSPDSTADKRLAEPTAPAPITPIFMRTSPIFFSSPHFSPRETAAGAEPGYRCVRPLIEHRQETRSDVASALDRVQTPDGKYNSRSPRAAPSQRPSQFLPTMAPSRFRRESFMNPLLPRTGRTCCERARPRLTLP